MNPDHCRGQVSLHLRILGTQGWSCALFLASWVPSIPLGLFLLLVSLQEPSNE